jgi:hypothetical protein
MARNGAGAYVLPAGSIVVDGDDATAAQHNTPLLDLQTDANTVRPIVAGGTGGNSASAARTALGLGTIATQSAGATAITGGTIEATAIGGTTPAAGAFTTLAASGVITSAGAAAALVVQDTDAADGDDKAQIRVDATVAYVQGTANGKLRLSGLGSTNLTDFSARIGGAWKDVIYDGYADDLSLGGTPTAPTAAAATNTTQIATTAYTRTAIADVLNAAGSAPLYACRAWVNFNGTLTVAIRASGNVSSITDQGTGQYRVNFATAMSDVNYAVTGAMERDIAVGIGDFGIANDGRRTTYVEVLTGNGAGTLTDADTVCVAIFR